MTTANSTAIHGEIKATRVLRDGLAARLGFTVSVVSCQFSVVSWWRGLRGRGGTFLFALAGAGEELVHAAGEAGGAVDGEGELRDVADAHAVADLGADE